MLTKTELRNLKVGQKLLHFYDDTLFNIVINQLNKRSVEIKYEIDKTTATLQQSSRSFKYGLRKRIEPTDPPQTLLIGH